MATAHWNAPAPPVARPDVALWRLYLLRGAYLLIAAGMGMQMWSTYMQPHPPWTLTHGVMNAMLLALALLSILGLRYPLKMLPLLFWEVTWKGLWLLSVALPVWRAGKIAGIWETTFACLMSVIFVIIVPWDHVWRNFVAAPAERLR
jgi:hypothetical protein